MSLSFHDVTVRYGRTTAVDRVTLEARAGEVLALIGPNGSGKSSLLKAAAGLIRHEGRIVASATPHHGRTFGYMPQETEARVALTVTETILLGRHHRLGLRLQEPTCGPRTMPWINSASRISPTGSFANSAAASGSWSSWPRPWRAILLRFCSTNRSARSTSITSCTCSPRSESSRPKGE